VNDFTGKKPIRALISLGGVCIAEANDSINDQPNLSRHDIHISGIVAFRTFSAALALHRSKRWTSIFAIRRANVIQLQVAGDFS
jgi:hypothetical protein